MRHFLPAMLTVSAALFTLVGCGAKTGLRVPDIGPDHIDATDTPDLVCLPRQLPLERRTADVMFLIDRSNSMRLDIVGTTAPPSRWDVLAGALSRALPPLQSTLSFGASFFPQTERGTTVEEACTASMSVDVPPARNNSDAILRVFTNTRPWGGTPTFQALRLLQSWFNSQPRPRDPRYIVLATDGGPNCNLALDYLTCRCTSLDDAGQPTCPTDPINGSANCLDDRRTLAEMRTIVATGIPIFVIGIDDPTRPDLTAVLTEMAIAGGRPNPSDPGYYRIRFPEDLDTAFTSIERTISLCAFTTAQIPPDYDAIHVDLAGQELPRDTAHANGWDVTDRTVGEITLYGAICDRVAHDPSPVLTVRYGCDDGG